MRLDFSSERNRSVRKKTAHAQNARPWEYAVQFVSRERASGTERASLVWTASKICSVVDMFPCAMLVVTPFLQWVHRAKPLGDRRHDREAGTTAGWHAS